MTQLSKKYFFLKKQKNLTVEARLLVLSYVELKKTGIDCYIPVLIANNLLRGNIIMQFVKTLSHKNNH